MGASRLGVAGAVGFVVLVIVLAGGGCGGRLGPGAPGGGDDGTGDDSGTGSAGGDDAMTNGTGDGRGIGDFPVCPPDAPAVGMVCHMPGQGCAYVYGRTCIAFLCNPGGTWAVAQGGC
jgi:hypothetical protein